MAYRVLLRGDGVLEVRGRTPSLRPYVVEVTDPTQAARWARALGTRRYSRNCVGTQTDRTENEIRGVSDDGRI